MFVKFDESLLDILCCSLCKGDLLRSERGFLCQNCGLFFPLTARRAGNDQVEKVYDFRLHWPDYCVPPGKLSWQETQINYEHFSDDFGVRDSLQEYLDEIDSVKEIYTQEFHICGSVLDVGGHQGRLRHFLDEDVALYVSIDPHIEVFRGMDRQPNLLKAYPCLSEPCNFLAAHGEYLPFKSGSFDWVHMRSVVDHFEDPYRAFLEAYRVARPGGKVLVGLAILEKIKNELQNAPQPPINENVPVMPSQPSPKVSSLRRVYLKWKHGGWKGLYQAALWRIGLIPIPLSQPEPYIREQQVEEPQVHDDHMYRFTHLQLIDLMERSGWKVAKEHWQKPPYYYCIYAMGEAQPVKQIAEK